MKRQLMSIALAAGLAASAQINSPQQAGYAERARTMYQQGNYVGCLQQLGNVTTDNADGDLHRLAALSAFALGQDNAETLIDQWLVDYPSSPWRADMLMAKADCLYTRNYAEALKAYDAINRNALTSENLRRDLDYRTGYCCLQLAEYARAHTIFESLSGYSRYDSAAHFYLAYIAYANGRYDEARTMFASPRINRNTAPGNDTDYYLAQIYYRDGDFSRALKMSQQLIAHKDANKSFASEARRIAGESLFQLDDHAAARPYLEQYVKEKTADQLNVYPTALYSVGICRFEDGDYAQAIEALEPVSTTDNALGQNAMLYLGHAMLRQGNKEAATLAFERALQSNHDLKATENAYYNYAVARYEGGIVPFSSSVKTFEDFLARFPKSQYADDVRQYLVTGYVNDNDYEGALTALNRMPTPLSTPLAKAKQSVLYTLGARNLAASNLSNAATYLRQANDMGNVNPKVATETKLALGETLYRTGNLSEAADCLIAYLDAAPQNDNNRAIALYDLGYTRFEQKDWAKAATNFERLINGNFNIGNDMLADAWARLADTHYYRKDWSTAAAAYNKSYQINPAVGDYAMLQQAVMQGYDDRLTDKLSTLDRMQEKFPTSALLPDALLEKSETQLQLGRDNDALATFEQLIATYPETAQARQAYLQKALALDKLGRHQEADDTYRALISRYPSSAESRQSAEILQRIYAAKGQLNSYNDFVSDIADAPQLDPAEADRISYVAAEEQWLDGKGSSLLKKYIADYPAGAYSRQATAYLMDAAEEAGNSDDAYNLAVTITERWPDSAEAEDAWAVRAEIETAAGDSDLALNSWQELERHSSSPVNTNLARIGIMRIARDMGDADLIIANADAVLASGALGTEDKAEARFSRGVALNLKGDTSGAQNEWQQIAGLTDDPYGVRAAVYLAQSYYDEKKYDAAQRQAEKIVNSGTTQNYWLARAFIVLADTLKAKGNKFEAKQYLEALRDNYPGTEADIFSMIDQRLRAN